MKKKRIPFINYNVTKTEDYVTLTSMKDTKRKVFDRLVEAVNDGLQSKKSSVDIFRIYESETVLILEKPKWKQSLEKAIDFYSSLEDFESCVKCQKLIENL